jgi:hypothetical protein
MTDPIRLPVSIFRRSPPAVTKIKRGGTGKISNSGNAPKRFRAFVKGLRDPKKPGKHDGGTLLPKPPRAPAVWDPHDPLIIAHRIAHPRVEAAWRSGRSRPIELVPFDLETRDAPLVTVS